MILRRLLVRRAMGRPAAVTRRELADLWGSRARLRVGRVVTRTAYDEADVEVDGEHEDTDWDEPATDWMDEKKAAVRRAVACLVNDPGSLPDVGRLVERIVRRVGTVDIYFDDGSFVSATVDDPGRRTASPGTDVVAVVRDRELLAAADARSRGALDRTQELG